MIGFRVRITHQEYGSINRRVVLEGHGNLHEGRSPSHLCKCLSKSPNAVRCGARYLHGIGGLIHNCGRKPVGAVTKLGVVEVFRIGARVADSIALTNNAVGNVLMAWGVSS